MTIILYGILLAHLNSYREYYTKIGITFAVTYLIKRLIKSAGSKEHAELIGLGGYTLTIGEFVKLLGAIKRAGISSANSEEANKMIGGFFGKGIDLIGDLLKGK